MDLTTVLFVYDGVTYKGMVTVGEMLIEVGKGFSGKAFPYRGKRIHFMPLFDRGEVSEMEYEVSGPNRTCTVTEAGAVEMLTKIRKDWIFEASVQNREVE